MEAPKIQAGAEVDVISHRRLPWMEPEARRALHAQVLDSQDKLDQAIQRMLQRLSVQLHLKARLQRLPAGPHGPEEMGSELLIPSEPLMAEMARALRPDPADVG